MGEAAGPAGGRGRVLSVVLAGAPPSLGGAPEHLELRDTLRRYFTRRLPLAAVRETAETDLGYDPTSWAEMAATLGLAGLLVPERCGGSDAGCVAVAIAAEEMGRNLVGAPFLVSAVMATSVLRSAKGEDDLLASLAAGKRVATVALPHPGPWAADDVRVTAGAGPADGWTLDGRAELVVGGHGADVVLVVAHTPAGLGLFTVDGDAAGLQRRRVPTFDQTRAQGTLEFTGVAARALGRPGNAGPIIEDAVATTMVALAAEQLGGAERCLEMSVDYARSRRQFDRPIGSFQAVKHTCADMFVAVQYARAAVYAAAGDRAAGGRTISETVRIAKAHASDAFVDCAQANIQVHGGIGYTWEHDAHLYLKRAKATEQWLGSPAFHRRRVLEAFLSERRREA